jgi:hypothetical protein
MCSGKVKAVPGDVLLVYQKICSCKSAENAGKSSKPLAQYRARGFDQ